MVRTRVRITGAAPGSSPNTDINVQSRRPAEGYIRLTFDSTTAGWRGFPATSGLQVARNALQAKFGKPNALQSLHWIRLQFSSRSPWPKARRLQERVFYGFRRCHATKLEYSA